MDDLYLRLKALGYNDNDFRLRDDGTGPYIDRWLVARPRPEKETLAAVSDTALDDAINARKRSVAIPTNTSLALVYAIADALKIPRETFINNIKDIYESL